MYTPKEIKAWMPQGLTLSTTLYGEYINDTLKTLGVCLALFVGGACMYATDRIEGYNSESCSAVSIHLSCDIRAGTLISMKITLGRSTSLTDLDSLRLISHCTDGNSPS
jgi:hypothetical protein